MAQIDALQNYLQLMEHNAAAHVIKAAWKTGVFAALHQGQLRADQIAEQCGLAEPPLQLTLDVLECLGAVEHYGDDYALSPAMRLVNDQSADLGDGHWQSLTRLLQGRQDAAPDDTRDAESAAPADASYHQYRRAQAAAQWTHTPAAMSLAELLGMGTARQSSAILDLGAGAGVWGLTLAYHDPSAHVTAIDFEPSLEVVRKTAEDIQVDSRLALVAGDHRTTDFGEQRFDMVIAANLVQLEPLERSQPWLQRARRALRPGGEIVVVSSFAEHTEGQSKRSRAIQSLELSLRAPGGRHPSVHEVVGALGQAGFATPQCAALPAPPHTLGVLVAPLAE